MIENGIINRFQFWLLVVNFTVGSALLLLPSGIIAQVGKDGWISMLIAILLGIALQFIMISLALRHKDKTLIDMIELLFGKTLGKLLGILYAWFFLHLSALVLRNAADFIKGAILKETPMVMFGLLSAVLLYFLISQGIESLGRSNELFTPAAFLGLWFSIFFAIPLMKTENIQPILANGIAPLMKGAYSALGFPFAELVVFLMFIPFINNKKNIKKIFISAGAVGGLSLAFVIISAILVLGSKMAEISLYSVFIMTRLINIADFITRFEAIISQSIIISIFIKIAVSFYGATLAIAQVFRLKDYRSIIVPLLIIQVTLSMILNDSVIEVQDFAVQSWTPYALIFGFIIPLLLLITSLVKKR